MRIEMPERDFRAYREPYLSLFGHVVRRTLDEAISAFFEDCGHRGSARAVSLSRGWVEIEVKGCLPAIFSTNGQAHNTVFYRKSG